MTTYLYEFNATGLDKGTTGLNVHLNIM